MRLEITGTFLLLVFIFASTQLAQAQSAGEPGTGKLESLSVTGSKRFTEDQLRAASGLHIGDAVGRADLQAAADRLTATGYFSNVQYRFSSAAADVSLQIQVADGPEVPIFFDNFPWFTDDELLKALRNSLPIFDGATPPAGQLLDQMDQILANLLPSRGIHAAVVHDLIDSPGSETLVARFQVNGASLAVSAVEFSNSLASQDARVQARFSDVVGKPFSRFAAELFVFESVRPVYLEKGFLRAAFGPPQAMFRGDPNKPLPSTVVVQIPIDPGPVFTWGSASWSGNHAISSSELDALLGLKKGDIADGMKIQAAWNRVAQEYGKNGYLEAKVEPQENLDEAAHRCSPVVHITEGVQYRMGDLVLTNLSLESEKRARAAWKIPKGEVFDEGYFDLFISKGIKDALSGLPVSLGHIEHFLRTNPQTATVDVLINFD
ncbi:MAG: POTRA domain-containing protein [Candidatus Acidiferrales bacterium]